MYAVVGCGIVGAACAYELASRGVDVTVFEARSIGNGSTARSAGGVRTQYSTRVNVELSLASLPTWESFEETFGVDIGFRQVGYLFPARNEETVETFERNVEMQREAGAPVELLSPAEAKAHCPGLRESEFLAATYAPCDGFADPYLALQGYVDAAREAGATIRTKTAVVDIHRSGEGIEDIVVRETGSGTTETIEVDAVVNAAGPWADRVADLAGIDVRVTPKRRQALVAEPETPVPEDCPLTIDLDTGAYFRPERDGAAIVGGTFGGDDPEPDPDSYDEGADLEWAATAIERAAETATYFGPETRVRRGWAGLYAVTPDHHPIIEETAPGFFNAIGFSGHGFQHAPATATVIAEIALDGEPSTVDVGRLSSDRFDRGERIVERNVV